MVRLMLQLLVDFEGNKMVPFCDRSTHLYEDCKLMVIEFWGLTAELVPRTRDHFNP